MYNLEIVIAYFLLVVVGLLLVFVLPQAIQCEKELWKEAKKNGWKSP